MPYGPSSVRRRCAIGRQTLEMYLSLKNALANWKRMGFSDEDLAEPGSDRLVDAVVAHGPADAIAAGRNSTSMRARITYRCRY